MTSALKDNQRRRGLLAGLFVVLVILAMYVGATLYFGDKVSSGTKIGGVDVGGLTPEQATAKLEDRLADEAATPITVEAGGKSVELDPREAGLTYDYEGSVDDLVGFSLNPVDLLDQIRGGADREIAVQVDEEALTEAVDSAAKDLDREPVDGGVKLNGTTVQQTSSKPGLAVDQETLVEDIEDGWPEKHGFTAESDEVEAELTTAEVDAFVTDELEPLVSGPVTVKSTDPEAKGKKKDLSFTVGEKELAEAVGVEEGKGKMSVKIDDKELVQAVTAAAEDSGEFRVARDATVVREGSDEFRVKPAVKGLALVEKGMADKVLASMEKTKEDERTVTLESRKTKAEHTTAETKRTKPTEQISTFTTHLTDDEERTENIEIAASTLDGAYVQPGEKFSLNGRLGKRTAEKGYNEASVIMNGRLVKDYGGGISQLSTTLFNAVFFSGAKIEEYYPHSWYISRYPEGREATISWPNVDQKFTNDTGAGIYISAHVEGDDVTVTFYGRKPYDDVDAEKSPRRDVVQPEKIVDDSADCVSQSPTPGFNVTVKRHFKNDGEIVKTSDFHTHYVPEDEVTCTHPDAHQ